MILRIIKVGGFGLRQRNFLEYLGLDSMLEQLSPQLQTAAMTVLRLSMWLTLMVSIFVPLERLFAVQPAKVLRKGIGTDFLYYFLNGLMTSTFLSVPIALLAWTIRQTIPTGFLEWSHGLPFLARTIIAFVAGEIGYYWGHRLCHEIPFLWRFHSIHHSAQHVDFMVNSRAHPVDMTFGRFCSMAPIYILGLGGPGPASESTVPVLVTLFAMAWGFFIHANLRWRFGPLEWLISTPAFHHWHHTLTPVNRNYSSTLPWLDRLFGTHYLPREFPKEYGIKGKMPDSFLDQLAYPLDPPAPPPSPAMVVTDSDSDSMTPATPTVTTTASSSSTAETVTETSI